VLNALAFSSPVQAFEEREGSVVIDPAQAVATDFFGFNAKDELQYRGRPSRSF
jgi:hypothetical protein